MRLPGTIVDILAGAAAAFLIPVSMSDAAGTLILPLAGLTVGLTFAWAGNSHALLQSSELEELAEYFEDGVEGMAYEYQLAILVVLVILGAWGLAGLEVFDSLAETPWHDVIAGVLYAGASMGLRASWRVVADTQRLLVTRQFMREKLRERDLLPRAGFTRGGADDN